MVFQNLTYNRETPCCNPKPIPVLLIMTSNAPAAYDMQILQKYQQTLNGFVGPTEVFACGDKLQLKDYSRTDWPWYFDEEAKQRRHEAVFPEERKQVCQLGAKLAK